MSIVLIAFDLVWRTRNPFRIETKPPRRYVSVFACISTIFVACLLAYGPFIWLYVPERQLEVCNIATIYGMYLHYYHILTLSVLSLLFGILIIASCRVLQATMKISWPKSLKGTQQLSVETHSFEANDDILKSNCRNETDIKIKPEKDVSADSGPLENVKESNLDNIDAPVEKVTINLSDYTGIETKRTAVLKVAASTSIVAQSNHSKVEPERLSLSGYAEVETGSYVVEKVTSSLSTYTGIDLTQFYNQERRPRNKSMVVGNSQMFIRNLKSGGDQIYGSNVPAESTQYYLSANRGVCVDNDDDKKPPTDLCEQKSEGSEIHSILDTLHNAIDDDNTAISGQATSSSSGNTVTNSTESEDKMEYDRSEKDTSERNPKEVENMDCISVLTKHTFKGSIEKLQRLTGNSEIFCTSAHELQKLEREKQKQVVYACKTFVAFMTVFLVCSLPFYVLSAVQLLQVTGSGDSEEDHTVRAMCGFFLYLRPIIDSALYISRFNIVSRFSQRTL